MIDRLAAFDAIYTLAADEGCEAALFGSCAALAREAFQRSLIGDEFPLLWFEVPLTDAARFDLHVAISRNALKEGVGFLPGAGNGYDALFDWYAREEKGGGGLAFAYDISDGRLESPAIHVNVNNAPLGDIGRFFDLAGGDGAAALYDEFASRLPRGWRIWYAGVHSGRPGAPIRVDCFVDRVLQESYARDASLLERDLVSCGFTASREALISLVAPILRSPFGLELQFDVGRDGTLGSTLGLSAGFRLRTAKGMRPVFEKDGVGAALMGEIESLGLADARWRRIPDVMYSKFVSFDDGACALYCLPVFVKLRMRDGAALDAKLYLQASAAEMA